MTSLETEQCIMDTAKASHASLSLDMENPVHIVHSMSQNKQVIPWDRLEAHSSKDTVITTLVNDINRAIPDNRESWPENTREYFRSRSELSIIGPVVLYGERVIIPSSLQAEALEVLHATH